MFARLTLERVLRALLVAVLAVLALRVFWHLVLAVLTGLGLWWYAATAPRAPYPTHTNLEPDFWARPAVPARRY